MEVPRLETGALVDGYTDSGLRTGNNVLDFSRLEMVHIQVDAIYRACVSISQLPGGLSLRDSSPSPKLPETPWFFMVVSCGRRGIGRNRPSVYLFRSSSCLLVFLSSCCLDVLSLDAFTNKAESAQRVWPRSGLAPAAPELFGPDKPPSAYYITKGRCLKRMNSLSLITIHTYAAGTGTAAAWRGSVRVLNKNRNQKRYKRVCVCVWE